MESLYNYDGFSWRRVAMVGRYFIPALRGNSVAMASICFALIIMACFFGVPNGSTMSSSLGSILAFAVVLTPLYFATKPADEIFNSLPAHASEKRTFIFLYSFIIMPALLLLPGELVVDIFFPDMNEQFLGTIAINVLRSNAAGWFIAEGLLSTGAQIAIGLWAAFASRGSRRPAITFLAIFGSISLNGILGFIMGFISALTEKPETIYDSLADAMEVSGPYIVGMWAIIFIFALYKASRAISRKQV